jgi:hypothetical protein
VGTRKLLIAAAAVGMFLAGCSGTGGPTHVPDSPAPAPTPTVQTGVITGSFCSPDGANGISKAGAKVRCYKLGSQPNARWHVEQ